MKAPLEKQFNAFVVFPTGKLERREVREVSPGNDKGT
jgi:hypothetical protein